MSGPKVVRIVTREEIEATCLRLLREVEEAAGGLRACARRLEALDDRLEADLGRRRLEFEALFAADRWIDIQKRAPEAVEALRAEGERLRHAAAVAAAEARSRRRRLVDGARTLVMAFEAAGLPADPRLAGVVANALSADEAALGAMRAALNEATASLTSRAAVGPTQAQLAFASRLSAGLDETPPGTERDAHPASRDRRLDALLAEATALVGTEAIRSIIERADAIEGEPSPDRRALLTDSLTLDVGRLVAEGRAADGALGRLREARAALADADSDAARAIALRVAAAIDAADTTSADRLLTEAAGVVEAHRREVAAFARRRAVLSGLASLGYEVRETMATAWARDGRLVVRKPHVLDYGVELAAPADASRLQVRLVGSDRPSTPRTPRRDADQETTWCGDFGKLRGLLDGKGQTITVERAVEAGAQVVKTVCFEDGGADTATSAAVPAKRVLERPGGSGRSA